MVRRIHVLMTGKLQTCFSRDSECLNHSRWIWHLSFSLLFYAHWKKHHMHLAVIMVFIICVDRHHLPDNDEMLAKWPGCETNIHWIEKWAWRHGNPARGKTWDGHVLPRAGVTDSFFSHPRGFPAWKLTIVCYVKFIVCYGFLILFLRSVSYNRECFLSYPMFYFDCHCFNIVSQTILGLCLPAASLYNNKIKSLLSYY